MSAGGNVKPLEVPQRDKDSLYEKGRPIIWVIEIKSKMIQLNAIVDTHSTGFSLECNGSLVIITRARKFVNATRIRARRFNGSFKTAKIKVIDYKLDLAMLEVDGDDQVTNVYGELVLDGSLSACQPLVYIGNPGNHVGSSFVGRVCFPCKNCFFDIKNYEACEDYKSRKMVGPIKHMVLGDVLQPIQGFSQHDKNLNAHVPIIQCDGFPGNSDFEGSPIFNLDGKIVGMLCFQFQGYFIAIHVAAIRAFLNSNSSNERVLLTEEELRIGGRRM